MRKKCNNCQEWNWKWYFIVQLKAFLSVFKITNCKEIEIINFSENLRMDEPKLVSSKKKFIILDNF